MPNWQKNKKSRSEIFAEFFFWRRKFKRPKSFETRSGKVSRRSEPSLTGKRPLVLIHMFGHDVNSVSHVRVKRDETHLHKELTTLTYGTYVRTYVLTYVRTYTRTYVRACVRACVRMYVRTYSTTKSRLNQFTSFLKQTSSSSEKIVTHFTWL